MTGGGGRRERGETKNKLLTIKFQFRVQNKSIQITRKNIFTTKALQKKGHCEREIEIERVEIFQNFIKNIKNLEFKGMGRLFKVRISFFFT